MRPQPCFSYLRQREESHNQDGRDPHIPRRLKVPQVKLGLRTEERPEVISEEATEITIMMDYTGQLI